MNPDSMVFSRINGLTRLAEEEFVNESEMENMVGSNLQKIFPCLTLLKKQFSTDATRHRSQGKSSNRFDMLAFDTKKNCFVVIEYKNKTGSHLIDQVFRYISIINRPNTDFIDAYGKATNTPRMPNDFNWALSYMITIAGNYTSKQLEAADGALNQNPDILKMYTIRKFDGCMMALDLANGTPVCAKETRSIRQDKMTNLSKTGPDQKMHNLFEKLDRKIKENMHVKHITFKSYTAYMPPTGKNICTVIPQKNCLKLYYAPRKRDKILSGDEFVKYHKGGRHLGAGDYMSVISNPDDIDKVIKPLKKVYDWRTGQA
ncbi:MAG: hypothetical protein EB828_00620 [Nitrosopumilus sp. D6]|nr:MAG: hypothetical protein EB828_00620 [Nitrosopumilus sp. D6]